MIRTIILALVFLWFLLGGIAHFAFTDIEMQIVPPSLPMPRLIVLITGVCELAGAAALLAPHTRRVAGWFLIVLTIAVTPANIYMLQHAERFPTIPVWALTARLPLQAMLIAAIWWSTRGAAKSSASAQAAGRSIRR